MTAALLRMDIGRCKQVCLVFYLGKCRGLTCSASPVLRSLRAVPLGYNFFAPWLFNAI